MYSLHVRACLQLCMNLIVVARAEMKFTANHILLPYNYSLYMNLVIASSKGCYKSPTTSSSNTATSASCTAPYPPPPAETAALTPPLPPLAALPPTTSRSSSRSTATLAHNMVRTWRERRLGRTQPPSRTRTICTLYKNSYNYHHHYYSYLVI